MKRNIIHIDEETCNGCGLCAEACHEGAIGMIDGKAKLLRDDYCDGLGDCLPVCPTNAIAFTEREAAAYDHEAVQENIKNKQEAQESAEPLPCGCPGTHSKHIERTGGCPGSQPKQMERAAGGCPGSQSKEIEHTPTQDVAAHTELATSELSQWPVQIKLVPVGAPYFDGARLLIAADCTAFAYRNFHRDFIKGRVTLIGCPKLDMGDYAEKLTAIIARNNIKDVTVVRMEVPCCGGIEHAVKTALMNSGKFIPWQVVTISVDGEVLN